MGLKEMTLIYEKSNLLKTLDRLELPYLCLTSLYQYLYINTDNNVIGIDEQLNIVFQQKSSISMTLILFYKMFE